MNNTDNYYGLTVKYAVSAVLPVLLLVASGAAADGLSIDKVYHPYVQALERELEMCLVHYDSASTGNNRIYKIGYGQSFADNWFAEIYVIGGEKANDFSADACELEARWQLTEQGKYSADWGVLFELEKETDQSIRELAGTLLTEREWGRTVATSNVSVGIESGRDIDTEIEFAGAFQLRYRYSRALEPALEYYLSQDTHGLGPVLMGEQRFGLRNKLHWEPGVIAGVSEETPDATLRAMLELEF